MDISFWNRESSSERVRTPLPSTIPHRRGRPDRPAFDVLAPVHGRRPRWSSPRPIAAAAYPPDFVERLAARSGAPCGKLRRQPFVDELFAAVTDHGRAPGASANFPRAFVDRQPGGLRARPGACSRISLPAYVNTAFAAGSSRRVSAPSPGSFHQRRGNLSPQRLRFDDRAGAHRRPVYRPYHAALAGPAGATLRRRFGGSLLVDCHSMPSVGGPMDRCRFRASGGSTSILGDCARQRPAARSAHRACTAERLALKDMGYVVRAQHALRRRLSRPATTAAPWNAESMPCRSRSTGRSTWTRTGSARRRPTSSALAADAGRR